MKYEHLVDLEAEVLYECISHEPAFPCVRRPLREGRPLPGTLRVDRPQEKQSPRYKNSGGPEWVSLEEEDVEDLLLNAGRDLTDEEMTRLIS